MFRQQRTPLLRVVLPVAILAIGIVASSGGAMAANAKDERDISRPFYLRDIKVGEYTLPFSPVTVVVMIISAILLNGIMFNSPKSTATASHILLDGNDAESKLDKMKKDLVAGAGDIGKFQALAKEHSKCPSGKAAGGSLGTFKPGMMVPAFDKAIFAKENKVGEAIGPIQTVRLTMHRNFHTHVTTFCCLLDG
jgi:peptidyl-prolyl cis-trans isomerase C